MSGLSVALVVQRYGSEVSGGAETLARRIAELLAEDVDLTVLTTCALDYVTWKNHYPHGETTVNGVRVLRFPVARPRDPEAFDEISLRAYAAPQDPLLGQQWADAQGPDTPELLGHLDQHGATYDAVVFVTYLYGTTIKGLPLVDDRALLVPAVHDEPPLRLSIFERVFELPQLLVFSTPEEYALARERFGVSEERARVVGAGAEEPPPSDPTRFASNLGLERPYALCVGRLDASKGVADLLDHHRRYRTARPDGVDLVLVGEGPLELPKERWLHAAGFVDEQTKHDALAGAAVVVVPSQYESLSLAQLEAWSHGCPTLVNAVSPVLVGQSRRAGGGLWYRDAEEYRVMLDFLASAKPLADALGRQGLRYVRRAHSWEVVRRLWLDALAEVAARTTRREARAVGS